MVPFNFKDLGENTTTISQRDLQLSKQTIFGPIWFS